MIRENTLKNLANQKKVAKFAVETDDTNVSRRASG